MISELPPMLAGHLVRMVIVAALVRMVIVMVVVTVTAMEIRLTLAQRHHRRILVRHHRRTLVRHNRRELVHHHRRAVAPVLSFCFCLRRAYAYGRRLHRACICIELPFCRCGYMRMLLRRRVFGTIVDARGVVRPVVRA
eukprot:4043135-Pleurochrysis_carterae.AAC.3